MSKGLVLRASVFVSVMSFSRAVGAGPVVEQHWVPHTPLFQQLGVFNYVDIPGSLKTVTIPAGTATVVWSFSSSIAAADGLKIRPVIGPDAPTEGLVFSGYGSSGSWSTATAGGTVTVKLQVASEDPNGGFGQDASGCSLAWTLVVYPEAAAEVPTIGGASVGILAALLAAGGTALLAVRREKTKPVRQCETPEEPVGSG